MYLTKTIESSPVIGAYGGNRGEAPAWLTINGSEFVGRVLSALHLIYMNTL